MSRLAAIILLVLVSAGCRERPKAPALRDDGLFDDPRAGVRMLVPPGWTQRARAALPEGPAEQERVLVRYSGPPGPTPPMFEVSCQDLKDSVDIADMVQAPSHNVSTRWTQTGAAVAPTVDGEPAMRHTLTHQALMKEVVVVRRKTRVYFFTWLGQAADTQSRDQIRQAIQETRWTK